MSSEKAVITLPLSVMKSNELGRFVSPIVGEVISKGIKGDFYLCLNLLDSYNNRYDSLVEYKRNLLSNGINYDNLWIDNEYIDLLIENIYKLIDLGYIYEMDTEIYRCDCGVIELEQKNLNTVNPDKRGYRFSSSGLICKNCGTICKLYKEKVLVFDPSKLKEYSFRFYPYFLNKDIKTFDKIVLSSYTVISRQRDTGIFINYNGNNYKIDIDFLWENYLSLFPYNEKVVLCGNKEIYQLYMTGILEQCLNNHSKTLFIGTPIINNINENNYLGSSLDDVITRKLAVIFNVTWGAKVKNFDVSLLMKLKKIPYERKQKIYDIITNMNLNDDDFYEMMDFVLRKQFNYQEVLKVLKRSR